jgi:hypothetical protein
MLILSNKERLLKGYLYQLAGSYDEAKQEYRIIIRNTPELLGKIISSLRVLIKLSTTILLSRHRARSVSRYHPAEVLCLYLNSSILNLRNTCPG